MNLPPTSQSQFFSSRLFNEVCAFLHFKDLIFLMLSSKSVYALVDEYLYHFLKKMNIINEDSKNIYDQIGRILAPLGIQKSNLIYRHFFYQELKVTLLNGKEFDPSNSMVLQTAFHKGVKEFAVGHKISAFLTLDNMLYYAKTNEFLDPKHCALATKNHVKSFSADRNLVYLTEFGQIFIVFYEKNLTTLELQEDLILFTLETHIDRFFSSYNFIILEKENKNEGQPEIFVFDLLDFDLKKINEPNRIRPIMTQSQPEFQSIHSCAVGSNVAYFLSKENKLYLCDLKSINEDRHTKAGMELVVFEFFKNKQITKIYSSFLSYFAVEQEKILTIDYWDNKMVQDWAGNVGFPDCVKLLKYHKITGLDLLALDRKFLNDTLGIKSEEIQNRFLREIEKKRVITFKPPKVYAWGNNSNGQLACFTGPGAGIPMKVNLPGLEEDDQIDKIVIGWVTSAILTKKKKLWISESVGKGKQQVLVENHHEGSNNGNNSNEKWKRKDSGNKVKEEKKYLVFSSTSQSKSHKWIDVTEFYSKKNKIRQSIKDVSISKETFVVIVSADINNGTIVHRKDSAKSAEFQKKNRKNSQKMKPASFIVSQLRWNQNIQKNQWVIGLEMNSENFELTFADFDQEEVYFGNEDAFIRYFKKEGEIVWDKHNKIDNF